MAEWLLEWQGYISGIAVLLLGALIGVIIRANNKRRANEKEQLSLLKSLTQFQETHTMETTELNRTIKNMSNELILARVDSQTAINVLIKVSNGIPFDKYIDAERTRLMASVNFKYKD